MLKSPFSKLEEPPIIDSSLVIWLGVGWFPHKSSVSNVLAGFLSDQIIEHPHVHCDFHWKTIYHIELAVYILRYSNDIPKKWLVKSHSEIPWRSQLHHAVKNTGLTSWDHFSGFGTSNNWVIKKNLVGEIPHSFLFWLVIYILVD